MEKIDWLIKFRRASTHETLDVMLAAALRNANDIRDAANAVLGHESRQHEIDAGLFCKKI